MLESKAVTTVLTLLATCCGVLGTCHLTRALDPGAEAAALLCCVDCSLISLSLAAICNSRTTIQLRTFAVSAPRYVAKPPSLHHLDGQQSKETRQRSIEQHPEQRLPCVTLSPDLRSLSGLHAKEFVWVALDLRVSHLPSFQPVAFPKRYT